jgi:hypothetical protein
MNKTSIKIIKRKDVRAEANARKQDSSGLKLSAEMNGEKSERSSRRKMADTISKWIVERRENRRSEEISAFRKLFGDEFLSGRTA